MKNLEEKIKKGIRISSDKKIFLMMPYLISRHSTNRLKYIYCQKIENIFSNAIREITEKEIKSISEESYLGFYLIHKILLNIKFESIDSAEILKTAISIRKKKIEPPNFPNITYPIIHDILEITNNILRSGINKTTFFTHIISLQEKRNKFPISPVIFIPTMIGIGCFENIKLGDQRLSRRIRPVVGDILILSNGVELLISSLFIHNKYTVCPLDIINFNLPD